MKPYEEAEKQNLMMTQRLRAAYPTVYGQATFAHGPGWEQILMDLGAELAPHGVHLGYIKEKYAVLTHVLSTEDRKNTPDAVLKALKRAVDRSGETCEQCGKPGRWVMNENQWESTLCADCQGPDDRVPGEGYDHSDEDHFGPQKLDPNAPEQDAADAEGSENLYWLAEAGSNKQLTLDQAIEHTEKVADSCDDWCGREHRQLAVWLRELRGRQEVEREPVVIGEPLDDAKLRTIRERSLVTRVTGFGLDNDGDKVSAYKSLADVPVLLGEVERLRLLVRVLTSTHEGDGSA